MCVGGLYGSVNKLTPTVALHTQLLSHTLSLSLSGADLSALVREAATESFKELMSFTISSFTSQPDVTPLSSTPAVHMKHFEKAFSKVHPSVNYKVNRAKQEYPADNTHLIINHLI